MQKHIELESKIDDHVVFLAKHYKREENEVCNSYIILHPTVNREQCPNIGYAFEKNCIQLVYDIGL